MPPDDQHGDYSHHPAFRRSAGGIRPSYGMMMAGWSSLVSSAPWEQVLL